MSAFEVVDSAIYLLVKFAPEFFIVLIGTMPDLSSQCFKSNHNAVSIFKSVWLDWAIF